MKLKALLTDVNAYGHFHSDLEITGIAYDSRKVQPGNLFVAVKGLQADGHDYLQAAKAAGASAFIVEKEGYNKSNYLKVASTRHALAVISRNFYGDPSKKMNLIGVTGTNGKTSITFIVRDLLRGMGRRYGLVGTIANQIGETIYPTQVTTPESLELNILFDEMVEQSTHTTVMEVSSHALSMNRVTALDFDVAVFTNLTQDHLDYHQTMQEYFKAKRKLFGMTKESVINADDLYGRRLLDLVKGAMSYGIDSQADLMAREIAVTGSGTSFVLIYEGRPYEVQTPFHGKIYVLNTLAAIGALLKCGFEINEILDATECITPVRGRLEAVENELDIRVLVDYAHTPDALKNVLTIARSFTERQLISVFGCGGDRDRSKRPKMGRISERLADFSIVTSDNPRSEEPMSIILEILEGMPDSVDTHVVEPDRGRAIAMAVRMAKPGDTIVIAGKGHETYQIIGPEVIDFDDRVHAMEAIKEREHAED